jgi:hypothetical protein
LQAVAADDKPAGAPDPGSAPSVPAQEVASLPATRAGAPPEADDRTVTQPGQGVTAPPGPVADRTEIQPDTDLLLPPPAGPVGSDPALAPPAQRPPPQVPGYDVVAPLGQGTYGEVWLARDQRTGIQVAIKFLAHGTSVMWQLVQAEVKQLARLHADPGIVQLLDVELDAQPPYYVMAHAERGSLAGRLERGPLPPAEALAIFRQTAEALAYVHAKGIRHCDLKPGNILLNARGRVLLADFGQAHLSSDATPALGTFFYMAPEQADLNGQIPDTRWDVYGLGAIFYAMLTGHPPHEDPGLRSDLAGTEDLAHRLDCYRAWVRSAPRPAGHRRVRGIDRPLVEIVDRCLETDPDRRLRDAGAVLAALDRRERLRRQRPLLVFGFVAQVLLFLVMAGIASWAVESGIGRSEDALTAQLLQSDRVSASLVASAVEREMAARKDLLERHAASPELRRAVRDRDVPALERLLARFNQQHEHRTLSWVLVDNNGRLLALDLNLRLPQGFRIPRQFAWRDWFNGRGDQHRHKDRTFPPIRRTHVSQPFLRQLVRELAIGISTPVFAPGDGRTVVGVLYTPVRLKDVHRWLDRVRIRDGFAVLVNERGQCLRHREEERIMPGPDQLPRGWACPTYRDAVRVEGDTAEYDDPVDGRTYLAGYAPLRQLGWGALVQHERGPALKPIADLRRQMLFLGGVMLVLVSLLVSGLWGWLLWTLRRKERGTVA